MITENTPREMKQQLDDVSMSLPNESYQELYVSNTVASDRPTFLNTENDLSLPTAVVKNLRNLGNGNFTGIAPTCRIGMSLLMEFPLKIMNGVSSLFNFQSQSPDSEIPAKRPYSPKVHCHKQMPMDVARGRGRGRGRSQLRRSGVSQSRHRQEQIRQRLSADIQDDLKEFEELGDCENDKEVQSTPCIDEDGRQLRYGVNGAEVDTGTSQFPLTFGYFNVKCRKQKQQQTNCNQGLISNNCNDRYVPECPIDVTAYACTDKNEETESEMNINRSRLHSDSSVDSEDSCYIVFENSSDSEYDYTTTDDEDEDQNCDSGNCRSKLKVRFSQHPVIHTMIAWDYAYRAARKGPWEAMVRDRARFKDLINKMSKILDPILKPQHRIEIWQHRFANDL
ncbi:uncharacterized protein LOC124304081 isoform X2 [Neodiprion virginianus]|uniref:uncharacterized protein LOC124304081 isoform X2 n=1 Tax=Neodiprion virginianus TaxID=2961670 RepID=UPI001EE6FD2F|nr:uncharacterized protein LOC124304081 isoform X2 [Neodiprion virginianus]